MFLMPKCHQLSMTGLKPLTDDLSDAEQRYSSLLEWEILGTVILMRIL